MFFRSVLCVTRGLVAFRPLTPPAYEAVGVKAYLIITGTSFEPVSPSSEGSVLATLPFACFAAAYIEASVGCCFAVVRPVEAPEATPMATKLSRPTNTNDASTNVLRRRRSRVVFDTLVFPTLPFSPRRSSRSPRFRRADPLRKRPASQAVRGLRQGQE